MKGVGAASNVIVAVGVAVEAGAACARAARRATVAEMVKAFILRIRIGLVRLVERWLWLD